MCATETQGGGGINVHGRGRPRNAAGNFNLKMKEVHGKLDLAPSTMLSEKVDWTHGMFSGIRLVAFLLPTSPSFADLSTLTQN